MSMAFVSLSRISTRPLEKPDDLMILLKICEDFKKSDRCGVPKKMMPFVHSDNRLYRGSEEASSRVLKFVISISMLPKMCTRWRAPAL